MAYQRGDYRYGNENRYGGDRWRDRERSDRRSGYDRGAGEWAGRDYGEERDRGFFDRAGDEVRSWFGDGDAERRRDRDQRHYGRETGWTGDRDRDQDQGSGYFGSDYDRSRDTYSRGDYGQDNSVSRDSAYGRPADTWGGSGFGGYADQGRRFDRIDAGSTGTQGVHPMSSASGGAYGAGYGAMAGSYGSSAREAAMIRGGRGATSDDMHDRHYSEWRHRQIDALDRDYDEYRREHQSKFEQEFAGWREKRQNQRQSLRDVSEHMEVMGSDGEHIGTVDCVKGDRIILTKGDENAGGHHHSIPCAWIDRVDEKVMVNKTSGEAMAAWRDEDRNRALFERDRENEGPHMLNRSFSGTY